MFENPGEKIRKSSKALFYLALISSAVVLIIGFVMLSKGDDYHYDGLHFLGKYYESSSDLKVTGWLYILYSLLLVFASYLSSLLIYGFGEIVEKKQTDSAKEIEPESKPADNKSELNKDEEMYMLDNLLSYGLITNEEYEEKKKSIFKE